MSPLRAHKIITWYSDYDGGVSTSPVAGSMRLIERADCNVYVQYQHDANRVIVFKRWSGNEEVLIFASLNNRPFDRGYVVQSDLAGIPDALWKKVFNSDAAIYGGQGVGSAGASLRPSNGRIEVNIPANGFVLFVRQ